MPPDFLPFLYKITSLSFVGLAYGFCHCLLVLIYNSLLFLNKPIFAGKITVFIYLFIYLDYLFIYLAAPGLSCGTRDLLVVALGIF